jgi:hypothetical protein
VNIKIAGKWMFIPLKMVLIGIDPFPYEWYVTKIVVEPSVRTVKMRETVPTLLALTVTDSHWQVATRAFASLDSSQGPSNAEQLKCVKCDWTEVSNQWSSRCFLITSDHLAWLGITGITWPNFLKAKAKSLPNQDLNI